MSNIIKRTEKLDKALHGVHYYKDYADFFMVKGTELNEEIILESIVNQKYKLPCVVNFNNRLDLASSNSFIKMGIIEEYYKGNYSLFRLHSNSEDFKYVRLNTQEFFKELFIIFQSAKKEITKVVSVDEFRKYFKRDDRLISLDYMVDISKYPGYYEVIKEELIATEWNKDYFYKALDWIKLHPEDIDLFDDIKATKTLIEICEEFPEKLKNLKERLFKEADINLLHYIYKLEPTKKNAIRICETIRATGNENNYAIVPMLKYSRDHIDIIKEYITLEDLFTWTCHAGDSRGISEEMFLRFGIIDEKVYKKANPYLKNFLLEINYYENNNTKTRSKIRWRNLISYANHMSDANFKKAIPLIETWISQNLKGAKDLDIFYELQLNEGLRFIDDSRFKLIFKMMLEFISTKSSTAINNFLSRFEYYDKYTENEVPYVPFKYRDIYDEFKKTNYAVKRAVMAQKLKNKN